MIPVIGFPHIVQGKSTSSPKPNVLLIAVDDLRPAIGSYGDKIANTPNIDRLASEGLQFNRAYIQQSVCAPSRASMMTGLRPDQLGVWDLNTHFRETTPDVITLPQYFKRHGYQVREVGKIYHDPKAAKDPRSWSGPSRLHITRNLPGHKYTLSENLEGTAGWKASATERADVADSAYIDGKVTDAAIDLLHELKDSTFFLAVGFRRPHLPFSAPKKYWDRYERGALPPPESPSVPNGTPQIALHDWKELRGYTDIPADGPLSDEKIKELRHGYYASVSYIDALTGKLMDELERLNLTKNTIIVFWSDHGFHLGEHGLWAKTTNFELDTRIPLIIRIPGQKTAGEDTDAIVESVDIYPTLADLSGLPVPENMAGKSLKLFIENPDAGWNKPAISQFPRPWFFGDNPEVMGYSIRTDRYRYTQWNNFITGEIVARELYDHSNDPLETENIIYKTSRRILDVLEDKLRESYQGGFLEGRSVHVISP